MNQTVKTLLLLFLPAGSVIALGYWGSRTWLINAILNIWAERASKKGIGFDISFYKKELSTLSPMDNFIIYRYTKMTDEKPTATQVDWVIDQMKNRKIEDRLTWPPLQGILYEGS